MVALVEGRRVERQAAGILFLPRELNLQPPQTFPEPSGHGLEPCNPLMDNLSPSSASVQPRAFFPGIIRAGGVRACVHRA